MTPNKKYLKRPLRLNDTQQEVLKDAIKCLTRLQTDIKMLILLESYTQT